MGRFSGTEGTDDSTRPTRWEDKVCIYIDDFVYGFGLRDGSGVAQRGRDTNGYMGNDRLGCSFASCRYTASSFVSRIYFTAHVHLAERAWSNSIPSARITALACMYRGGYSPKQILFPFTPCEHTPSKRADLPQCLIDNPLSPSRVHPSSEIESHIYHLHAPSLIPPCHLSLLLLLPTPCNLTATCFPQTYPRRRRR